MNKKIVYFIIGSLILAVVVAIAIVRNELTDRVNPFLDMEDAYAQVEKGTQNYENVDMSLLNTKESTLKKFIISTSCHLNKNENFSGATRYN